MPSRRPLPVPIVRLDRVLLGVGLSLLPLLPLLSLSACSASVRSHGAEWVSQRPDRVSDAPGWVRTEERPDRFDATSGPKLETASRRPDRVLPGAPASAGAPQPSSRPTTGWARLDLRNLGIDAQVEAPVGAEVLLTAYGVTVRRAPAFAIEIKEHPVDFAARIHEIEHDPLRPLRHFLGEAHDTLLYQTASVEGARMVEYHFVTQVESAGKFFTCEDVRGQRFGLAEVETMLHACRTLQARSAPLPTAPHPPIGPQQTPTSPDLPPEPQGGADLLP